MIHAKLTFPRHALGQTYRESAAERMKFAQLLGREANSVLTSPVVYETKPRRQVPC